MPIQECKSEGKPGYKYGEEGFCYIYNLGDEQSRKKAYEKASAQGRAIEVSKQQKLTQFSVKSFKLSPVKSIRIK